LIVFDDLHLEPLQTSLAIATVEDFVSNGAAAFDGLVLLAPAAALEFASPPGADRRPFLNALHRLKGRKVVDPCQTMTEHDAMRVAVLGADLGSVRRPSQFQERSACPASASMDAEAIHRESQRRDTQTLEALARTLPVLDSGGKRNVVLVSSGFIDDPTLSSTLRSLSQASLQLQVVLYFIDVRALVGFFDTEKRGGAIGLTDEVAGAERLAEDTGGFSVRNTNDLRRGLNRIAEEGRNYYLIGYSPADASKAGEYRRIKVRVDRPGLKVRCRPGYFRY
jgi:VWFA-related protein